MVGACGVDVALVSGVLGAHHARSVQWATPKVSVNSPWLSHLACLALPPSPPHMQGYLVALLSTLMAPRAIPSTSQPNPLVEDGLEGLLEGDEGQNPLEEWRSRDAYEDFPDYIITCPLDPQHELVTGTYSIISLPSTTGKGATLFGGKHVGCGWQLMVRGGQPASNTSMPPSHSCNLVAPTHSPSPPCTPPQTPPYTRSRLTSWPPS